MFAFALAARLSLVGITYTQLTAKAESEAASGLLSAHNKSNEQYKI